MAEKRGRPVDPDSQYRMKVHRNGAHMYASTQPGVMDAGTGKKKYQRVHWGRLTEEMRFIPNERFLLLPPEERARFIYPESWDLSEVKRLPSHRSAGRPAYLEADRDRLYGHVWLMEQIAAKVGLLKDLETVFDGNREKALDVLSLAMYAYLTQQAYSHMGEWQEVMRFPAVHRLTPPAITTITQSITEQNRMDLFRCRKARLGAHCLCALDSTTRSSEGSVLSDVRFGKSKDGGYRKQTTEVVVYSLDTHEPIYYRTFPGNMNDSRSLRIILQDLRHAGLNDVVLVTDRGYECVRNIDRCIVAGQSLVTAAKVRQKAVLTRIREIDDPDAFVPDGMTWLPEEQVYARQYELTRTLKGRGGCPIQSKKLRLNLYLDPQQRSAGRVALLDELSAQEHELRQLKAAGTPVSDEDLKNFDLYQVTRNSETQTVEAFERCEQKIQKASETLGFFANMTIGVDYTAEEALCIYHRRDEQEKYFYDMKTRLHADRQHNWSETGMRGVRFIEFVALIMVSYIKYVWAASKELRRLFPYAYAILVEMRTIHCIEHTGKTKVVTPFIGKQLDVCKAFGLEVPADCAPVYIAAPTSGENSEIQE